VKVNNPLKGTLPSERSGHSSAIYGDKLFIFGGEDS
jgi:hypothetical protein